ncbi:hypothetical protein MMC15_005888 [Xylographa vitiligo]|nr:hypothetical protein [Xylographa vitiligo]
MYSASPSSFQPVLTNAQYVKREPSYSYPEDVYSGAHYSRADGFTYATQPLGLQRMHSYGSSYDEPIQEAADVSVYDPPSPQIPEIEKGNKLLSFQRSTCSLGLLDYSMRQTSVSLAAQLHGMFFLAKSSRAGSEDMSGTPAELTCYRRNLFQITGYVTVPRMIQYVVTDQGDRLPIVSQKLSISASESVEGGPIKIISVPFKPSATGAPPIVEEKTEKEPTPVQLDQTSSHEVDGEFNIYPFAWKRLQFRVATANNGRRKELQQHFTVRLFVTATLSNGAEVSICQALSGPVVVRGRSPRNFQTKEDVPLPDSRPPGRKSGSSPSASRRPPTESHQLQIPANHDIDMVSNDGYSYSQAPTSHHEWRNFSSSSSTTLQSSTLPSTPSVSPYVKHEPELKRVRKTLLKRKSSYVDPKTALMLTIPQEVAAQQTRSAPPERPRKSSRHALVSSAQSYLSEDTSTLPTSAFRFASIMGNPTYASSGSGRTTNGDLAEMVYGYYPSVEDWVYPAGQDYQSANGTQGQSAGGISCPHTAKWG